MNKRILILALLLIMSPVFADEAINKQEGVIIQTSDNESFVPDKIIDEQAPTLDGIVQPKQTRFKTFKKKVKSVFTSSKQKNQKVNIAKDVEPEEPDTIDKKSIKSQKNNDSKKTKKEKKTDKKQKKSAKKVKKAEKTAKGSALSSNETAAVNQAENNTVLIDTAYHGSVNTTKIMEVDECVKIALEKHPLIKSAMGNAEIYKSKIGQAWANYFPTLSAGISYSRNDMQVSNFAFPTQVYDMYYTPRSLTWKTALTQ